MSEPEAPKLSAPFTKMVEQIDRNAEDFGGAFVIVPPAGAGETVQGLLLTSADPVQFWMLLQSQVTKSLENAKSAQTNPYGTGRR